MMNISVPYLHDRSLDFSARILPEYSDKNGRQKPIIRLKYEVDCAPGESIVEVNRQRKIWSWLTLGIPYLIEKVSLLYSGAIRREKIAKPLLEVSFDVKDLMADLKGEVGRGASSHKSTQKIAQLLRYNSYNQQSLTACKQAELHEATRMMGRIINEAERARERGDIATLRQKQTTLRPFIDFLEKNNDPKLKKKDFDEADWAIMDLINFEQAKRFFSELSTVFNADWVFGSRLERQMRSNFDVNYFESVIAENLALKLAYIEDLESKTISLPVFDKRTKTYLPSTYTIRQTRIGDALPCYVLESENWEANPWLIIRGTSSYIGLSKNRKELRTGAFESVLADALDPECIARNVLNKALVCRPIIREKGVLVQKESIRDIFMRWKLQNKKVNMAGHSLGGVIANALTVEFYDQIKTAYTFSSPGVSLETADKWDELGKKNKRRVHLGKLVNYDYEGDFVPSGGRRLIGNHLAIKSTKHAGVLGLYETHVLSHLNNDCLIQRVDIVKENHKLARYLCEKLRIVLGHCFRLLLGLFSRKYIPDWWKQRTLYRERASFERSIRHHFH
ncbi:MAG: hypothetical protein WCF65_07265 [Parachlamydiaceae bacterium]